MIRVPRIGFGGHWNSTINVGERQFETSADWRVSAIVGGQPPSAGLRHSESSPLTRTVSLDDKVRVHVGPSINWHKVCEWSAIPIENDARTLAEIHFVSSIIRRRNRAGTHNLADSLDFN